MLSEMKPYHLWLIVCVLVCLYTVLIYPLLATEYESTVVLSGVMNMTPNRTEHHLRAMKSSAINEIDLNQAIAHKKYANLVGWSSDFHISTVKDIKDILRKFQVKVIDKSLSGHCHLTNTCGEGELRVINKENGITLSSCPNDLKIRFYEEYKDDEEFNSVDFFLCTHASGMCELFMPFGKPIIIVASTRYEIGRHDPRRWREWNENLALIMTKSLQFAPRSSYDRSSDSTLNTPAHMPMHANVIAANNRYDQEYMMYFTGLADIQLIPSICLTFPEENQLSFLQKGASDLLPVRYSPTRDELLIAPSRDVNPLLAAELIATAAADATAATGGVMGSILQIAEWAVGKSDIEQSNSHSHSQAPPRPHLSHTIKHIRDLYPSFRYTDLAAHPAVILLPYQVSFMLFFELYSMGVPMFAPSPSLLTTWHLKHNMLKERTWDGVFGHPEASSALPRHPHSSALSSLDPNNEFDFQSILEWVSLADFYQFPHVTTFESFSDLLEKIEACDLRSVSQEMMKYNEERVKGVSEQWGSVLEGIGRHKAWREKSDGEKESSSGSKHTRAPRDINSALKREYGVELTEKCTGHREVQTP